MKRYIRLFALIAALCALLCGCMLAREDMDAASAPRDRLTGVYITTDYIDLFDIEGYISANPSALHGGSISGADSARYGGRLYAELIDGRYVFPGVDGLAFFTATTVQEYGISQHIYTDNGICGGNTAIHQKDGDASSEESLELECTIYGIAGAGKQHTIYINPVYQTAEGDIYLTAGHGTSMSGEPDGGTCSHKIAESTAATAPDGSAITYSTSISVTYAVTKLPVGYTLIEMDASSREIARREYAAGELPPEYAANADTAYIVLEERTTDGSTYALYSAGNNSMVTYAELKEKGVLTEEHTHITFASAAADISA